eukprot:m.94944 g.94944  ORF g.94944 m.94944 type:complete len:351 (-) comp15136_c1_seq2:376-1428(-)
MADHRIVTAMLWVQPVGYVDDAVVMDGGYVADENALGGLDENFSLVLHKPVCGLGRDQVDNYAIFVTDGLERQFITPRKVLPHVQHVLLKLGVIFKVHGKRNPIRFDAVTRPLPYQEMIVLAAIQLVAHSTKLTVAIVSHLFRTHAIVCQALFKKPHAGSYGSLSGCVRVVGVSCCRCRCGCSPFLCFNHALPLWRQRHCQARWPPLHPDAMLTVLHRVPCCSSSRLEHGKCLEQNANGLGRGHVTGEPGLHCPFERVIEVQHGRFCCRVHCGPCRVLHDYAKSTTSFQRRVRWRRFRCRPLGLRLVCWAGSRSDWLCGHSRVHHSGTDGPYWRRRTNRNTLFTIHGHHT